MAPNGDLDGDGIANSEDGDIAEIATRMFKIARKAVNGGKS